MLDDAKGEHGDFCVKVLSIRLIVVAAAVVSRSPNDAVADVEAGTYEYAKQNKRQYQKKDHGAVAPRVTITPYAVKVSSQY
jgi:hypothetical protein